MPVDHCCHGNGCATHGRCIWLLEIMSPIVRFLSIVIRANESGKLHSYRGRVGGGEVEEGWDTARGGMDGR